MLETIAEGVFGARGWLKMIPGWWFPIRMTVFRLRSGGVVVHSPIRPTPALFQAVGDLGPVQYIVAPNTFHHLFVGKWMEEFPQATLLAAAGLESKRPDLDIDVPLPGPLPTEWDGELLCHEILGIPGLGEVVFLHVPSRTLVVTDLIFNIKETRGMLTPLILMISGCHNKAAQSRLIRFSTKDRRRAGESVRALLTLDFDRVSMAHGEVIESEGKAILAEACRWMLEGAALPAPSRS